MTQKGLHLPRAEYIEAVKIRDENRVKSLLVDNEELLEFIDEPWFEFDAPAVVFAASMVDRPLVEVLLDAGADINVKSSWWAGGTTALQHAAGSMLGYSPKMADYLIGRGATIDAHSAAGLDMFETLEALIRENPDVVNAPGCDGMSPLHFSATPRIAELLLKNGADINLRDRDHWGTAAQWTIRRRPEVCEYLLDQGAEADVVLYCARGYVEQARAVFQKNPEILSLRLNMKASEGYIIPSSKPPKVTGDHPQVVPGGHVYAYQVGPTMPLLEIALQSSQPAIVDLLIDLGYEINLRDWYVLVGQGPKRFDTLLKGFLAKGLDINALQKHRRGMWTPLHWVAQRGLTNGVACLLANGANPNVTDDKGQTPLHFIAHKGVGKNQAELLIEHGADVNARDDAGQTPLDYAKKAKRKSVADFLTELSQKG
ncbi:MAG: ankyrin repeat domain-containing protein [Candidatus Poribacteria bacterium]|nr:ankyrin repeat domain-containing protein [Candidatus Poribacteria bacterium]